MSDIRTARCLLGQAKRLNRHLNAGEFTEALLILEAMIPELQREETRAFLCNNSKIIDSWPKWKRDMVP